MLNTQIKRFANLALFTLLTVSVFAQTTPTQSNSEISIAAKDGKILIDGLNAPAVHVKVFDEKWLLVSGQWVSTRNLDLTDLEAGNYFVSIEMMDASRSTTTEVKVAFVYVADEEKGQNHDGISISGGEQIAVSGLPAHLSRVSVYNDQWLLVNRHFSPTPETAVADLEDGKYFVRLEVFNADRSAVVSQKESYVAVGGSEISENSHSINKH